jgi:hypothetical protein
VWEANRKIFLFPENWLEPEFRDDKTHLFTELEGALLQGDVSSDLVEDAFLNYLKKLDELARLDIVAMHIEDNPDPARRVLHVFGRTYSVPHKYFYRRYKNQMWTPWEPVSAQIEGDHLAPVVWRDRLYLFWVTFMEKPQQSLNDTTIPDPTRGITIAAPSKDIEAHLHWSEYVNGQWTTRESSRMDVPSPIVIGNVLSFDRSKVFVHVSKEYDADGSELGVYIHLGNWSEAVRTRTGGVGHNSGDVQLLMLQTDGADNNLQDRSFYLAGRNSAPEKRDYMAPPTNPFSSANAQVATRYKGSGSFKVSFKEKLTTEPGKTPPQAERDILGQGAAYTLLPCDNDLLPLGVSEDAYRNAANPADVKAAIESGLSEIATLMKPVFYQDNRHTFFVEPSVTEKTIEEWEEWVISTSDGAGLIDINDWYQNVLPEHLPYTVPQYPLPDQPIQPTIPWPVDKVIFPPKWGDWVTNPFTVLKLDDELVGAGGRLGVKEVSTTTPIKEMVVPTSTGSHVSGPVVVTDMDIYTRSGPADLGGKLNVVGSAGLDPTLTENINESNRAGFGAGMPGAGRLGR